MGKSEEELYRDLQFSPDAELNLLRSVAHVTAIETILADIIVCLQDELGEGTASKLTASGLDIDGFLALGPEASAAYENVFLRIRRVLREVHRIDI